MHMMMEKLGPGFLKEIEIVQKLKEKLKAALTFFYI